MNSHANPTKLTGSPCSCGGSSKPCKCGGAGGCDCGGACQVDTMVRPRFFAGQLLTEDDLQSLEDYVLAKNRLHNRHLFGAGVVCGLEVLCDPCGGGHVAVQPGYALDCCGNDISLDCRISLDINVMVRDLRRDQLGGADCGDPCTEEQRKLNKSAEKPPREYCLYVRYCEQESDPVSPYAVDEPCSAQTCEPSRIREGIRFELRCRQPDVPEPGLLETIKRCFADVVGLEKATVDALSLGDSQSGTSVRTQAFNELRARLLDLIDRSPHLVRCKLRDEVLAVQPPPSAPDNTIAGAAVPGAPNSGANAIRALKNILVEILKECMCMALNPPCAPCDDTGVLLACLKIKDCEVIEICNLHRRFVMTPVALRYWSSFGTVERFAEQICCGELDRIPPALGLLRSDDDAMLGRDAARTAAEPQPMTAAATEPVTAASIRAAPATYLKAVTVAFASLYPRGSVEAVGFNRMSEAFAMFAGEKIEPPAAPVPPAKPAADLTDATRATIEQAVAKQMKIEVDAKLEEAVMAADPVKHLQDQIDDLKTKLAGRGKRKPSGDPQ
ncbi:MAG TPA: hypothetical protein VGO01_10000 [Bradyrhizobium sp.]|jgi:hypothetical protein|nr:hypothetical protein [Bradyrhizobium sp.]